MGFLSKIGQSIGSLFNDITGTTSAAKLQNKYQKEFAQNAHQWEMQDLKKAGLNPILTATGGSGANAGGAGGTTGSSGINPIDTLIGTINGIQTAKKTASETKNTEANTLNTIADTLQKNINTQIAKIDLMIREKQAPYLIKQEKEKLNNMLKQTEHIHEQIKQIKGGKISGTIGTDPIKTAKELGIDIKPRADGNTGFGISFHTNKLN